MREPQWSAESSVVSRPRVSGDPFCAAVVEVVEIEYSRSWMIVILMIMVTKMTKNVQLLGILSEKLQF